MQLSDRLNLMSDRFVDNGHDHDPYFSEYAPDMPPNYEANMPRFPLRGKEFAERRRNEEDFPRNGLRADRQTPLIRVAISLDAKDLKEMAQSVSLSSMNSKSASDNGFLVSGFRQIEYSQFVKKAEHFLTIHIGTELVGFLLAYGSEEITDPEKEELNMYIKNNLCRKFVLLKQICISPKAEHRRKGFAGLLYRELYARILHYYEHEKSPSTRRLCRNLLIQFLLHSIKKWASQKFKNSFRKWIKYPVLSSYATILRESSIASQLWRQALKLIHFMTLERLRILTVLALE